MAASSAFYTQNSNNMALIYCPECGNKVSSYAPQCPKCGFPVSSAWSNVSMKQPDNESTEHQGYAPEQTVKSEQHQPTPHISESENVSRGASAQSRVEYPKLKVDGLLWGGRIAQCLMLVGVALYMIASYVYSQMLGYNVYFMSKEPASDDVMLSPTLMLIYVALSVVFVVVVIRRNHNMAILLSIGTLIATILMRIGINDIFEMESPNADMESAFGTYHLMSIFGIIMVGVGAVVDKICCRSAVSNLSKPSTNEYSPMFLALLFALLMAVPMIYPEWECTDKNILREIGAKDLILQDYLMHSATFSASIVGFICVALKRYRASLMAALFAVVATIVAMCTKRGVDDYLFSHLGLKSSDLSLTFGATATLVIAVVLVVSLIVLLVKDRSNEKDSWRFSIPIFFALAAIVLGECGGALVVKNGHHTITSSLMTFDSDVTLYLKIAIYATLIFVVCRQHAAAFISSLLSIILMITVVILADKVKGDVIVYGAIASSALTLFFTGYNADGSRHEVRLDVIAVVVACLGIYSALEDLYRVDLDGVDYGKWMLINGVICMLVPSLLLLVYSLRRSTLASISILAIILIALYNLSSDLLDTRQFNAMVKAMEPNDKGLFEGLMLLKNCCIGLLICAVLYEPAKRLISYLKAQQKL